MRYKRELRVYVESGEVIFSPEERALLAYRIKCSRCGLIHKRKDGYLITDLNVFQEIAAKMLFVCECGYLPIADVRLYLEQHLTQIRKQHPETFEKLAQIDPKVRDIARNVCSLAN